MNANRNDWKITGLDAGSFYVPFASDNYGFFVQTNADPCDVKLTQTKPEYYEGTYEQFKFSLRYHSTQEAFQLYVRIENTGDDFDGRIGFRHLGFSQSPVGKFRPIVEIPMICPFKAHNQAALTVVQKGIDNFGQLGQNRRCIVRIPRFPQILCGGNHKIEREGRNRQIVSEAVQRYCERMTSARRKHKKDAE